MELTQVPRIGPQKAARLSELGITNAEALAKLDMRTVTNIPQGWTKDGLRRAKQEARTILEAQGIGYERAPYHTAPNPAKPWWKKILKTRSK